MITPKQPSRMIGESIGIKRLRERITRLAPTPHPVLIEGPTGSGKELVAEALHNESARRGRIVAVNICAIPDTMFESTLFGHVRGAFTGASQSTPGLLREADGGTLFLDEIGSLGLNVQAKLLRALDSGEFRPVGASRPSTSSFRVVAATNESLEELVREGTFRADLWFRLRGMVLHVPPLIDRVGDIRPLVQHFLGQAGSVHTLTEDGWEFLEQHSWPGNVRELRQVVTTASGLCDGDVISKGTLQEAFGPSYSWFSESARQSDAKKELLALLKECSWDTARVAKRLGVHRVTVYRRMQRLGIRHPNGGSSRAG